LATIEERGSADVGNLGSAPPQIVVRISVHAATANPTDVGVRSGTRAEQQKADPPPYVPEMGAAGVIDEVGSGVPDVAWTGRAIASIAVEPSGGGCKPQ